MSYERLNLQDFVDVLTAAKVSHIEDGIVNNESRLNTVASSLNTVTSNLSTTKNQVSNNTNNINSNANEITNLNSLVRDVTGSEISNSILPLWHTLLSDGGEKIFPPQFSFNGNVIGQTFLPVSIEDEVSAGYIRLGEDIGMTVGIMTYGGCYHAMNALLFGMLSVDSDDFSELFFDTNSSLNEFGMNNLSLFTFMGQDSYDFGDNPVVIYDSPYHEKIRLLFGSIYSNFIGKCPSIQLPSAFSIDRDFEYNGIIYPSGFYGLFIDCNFAKSQSSDTIEGFLMTDLPYFYVNRVWPLANNNSVEGTAPPFIDIIKSQLNMPLDYSKASNAFECAGESIYWNGTDILKSEIIIPSDHNLSFCKCISRNPQAFLQACLKSTSIELIQNNNVTRLYVNIHDNLEPPIKALVYTLGYDIWIIPTTFQMDNYNCIPAGVYALNNQPFELKFYGVDTEKLFNPYKIDNQYLPEVPEFNLVEMGMSNVPLTGNFVDLNMNTAKLKFCSQRGPVRITIPTEAGEVSCLATFNRMGSSYQSVVTGYYSTAKFDTVIIFTDDYVSVGIFPVSQFA